MEEAMVAARRMGEVIILGRRWGIAVLLLLGGWVREQLMGIIRRIRSIRRRRSTIGVRAGVVAALAALRLIRIRWGGCMLYLGLWNGVDWMTFDDLFGISALYLS